MTHLGAYGLSDEHRMLRETVRRFMANEVRPIEDCLEHDATCPGEAELAELQTKAKKLGLWLINTPAEYGGAGLDLMQRAIVSEEAAQCRMGAYVPACGAFGFDPPSIIFKGTPDQIKRYAEPSVEGRTRGFVAISEAAGGSDPARAIECRAVRKGDRYIVNGAKMWITNAKNCDWGIVYVRTGEKGERDAITCLIVDIPSKGLSFREIPVIRSYSPYEVVFEDVEIPVENRIGEEGGGFRIADRFLISQRVTYAAISVGTAQAAQDMVIPWANERKTFGSVLADKQAIQWMIVDNELDIRSARNFVFDAAARADAGEDFKMEASIAKLVATEAAGRVVDRCMQIFGGLGVSREMPLERWYRESRIRRIGEGPSEVQRMVVARSLLGRRSR